VIEARDSEVREVGIGIVIDTVLSIANSTSSNISPLVGAEEVNEDMSKVAIMPRDAAAWGVVYTGEVKPPWLMYPTTPAGLP
jgi:uncharacterized membrane protein